MTRFLDHFVIASARFEAARSVDTPGVLPENHPCKRLHGHSFWASCMQQLKNDGNGFEHHVLDQELSKKIESMNYSHLNEFISIPTDENLARYIYEHINDASVSTIGLQSTKDQGIHLENKDNIHLWKRYQFEAAHQLPNVKPGHKCGRMHGHSFQVILHARTSIESKSISIDYDEIDRIWNPIHQEVNYKCLNDINGLQNPTSELLAKWIWDKVKPTLSELSCVSVYETRSCGAHYNGDDFTIWKDFSFDSAVKFPNSTTLLNKKTDLEFIHGHTYLLRLNLSAPLNPIMGWTKDFGDVKEIFSPIFKEIDHRPLYENSDIKEPTLINIGNFILKKVKIKIPEVSGLELYEKEGIGIILKDSQTGPLLPLTQT